MLNRNLITVLVGSGHLTYAIAFELLILQVIKREKWMISQSFDLKVLMRYLDIPRPPV